MSSVALLGAACGLGIWLIIHALGTRTSLSDVGATLSAPGRPAMTPVTSSRTRMQQRLAMRVVDTMRAVGVDPNRRAADLRVTRRNVDQHVLAKVTMALICCVGGGLLPLIFGYGAGFIVLFALGGATLGFLIPELTLTSEAAAARKSFRHAYGAFLDLVNVMLAAGAGPEAALHTAADSGGGWAFTEIRNALAAARSTRRSIADALADLGEELGVIELIELSASVALTGNQGARIRASLAAKADTLRAHQVSETEADAESATERMTLPVVILLMGFLLFLAYPAVTAIGNVGGG
jgi:Flp pilus assembly protein TadB